MVGTSCTPPTTLIPSALSQCYNVHFLSDQSKLPGLTLVLALVESYLRAELIRAHTLPLSPTLPRTCVEQQARCQTHIKSGRWIVSIARHKEHRCQSGCQS